MGCLRLLSQLVCCILMSSGWLRYEIIAFIQIDSGHVEKDYWRSFSTISWQLTQSLFWPLQRSLRIWFSSWLPYVLEIMGKRKPKADDEHRETPSTEVSTRTAMKQTQEIYKQLFSKHFHSSHGPSSCTVVKTHQPSLSTIYNLIRVSKRDPGYWPKIRSIVTILLYHLLIY